MEENILLLREIQYNCINQSEYIDSKCNKKAKAIEAILKELERLKQENERLNSLLKFSIDYRHKLEEDLYEGASNFIVRKDKIREKLKENKAKTDCKHCDNTCDSYQLCKFLEELLGDE